MGDAVAGYAVHLGLDLSPLSWQELCQCVCQALLGVECMLIYRI